MHADSERENAAPSKTRIVAYETLPEVEQMQWIMKSIYTDYCVRKIESKSSSVGKPQA